MGLPLTPSAALPLDPAGDSAAHSSPCSLPLVSYLLQNCARTNSQNDHLIIKFVTNYCICNKCNNEVNFYICTKLAFAFNSALKTVYLRFSAVFAFEADDCGWLVG